MMMITIKVLIPTRVPSNAELCIRPPPLPTSDNSLLLSTSSTDKIVPNNINDNDNNYNRNIDIKNIIVMMITR